MEGSDGARRAGEARAGPIAVKAHRLAYHAAPGFRVINKKKTETFVLYHSTLGLRVTKKKKKTETQR